LTALACTLPRDFGKPLSRWSARELARAAPQHHIVRRISPATVKRWLRAERIKPWQYRNWQQSTDPRFLERALPILRLYERAQALARAGHAVVCVDEKTSIQARQLAGGVRPARRGQPVRIGDRYRRRGALQLFAALQVADGETLARCFATKRFAEFQTFLRTVFQSLWCRRVRCLHLILDNGSTHAPQQLAAWMASLKLGFVVKLHWLPVHASWLDQIEIVFSQVQRKVLTPNHYESVRELETTLLAHFDERNKQPQPIQWSYTAAKLLRQHSSRAHPRLAA
jgi:transposase